MKSQPCQQPWESVASFETEALNWCRAKVNQVKTICERFDWALALAAITLSRGFLSDFFSLSNGCGRTCGRSFQCCLSSKLFLLSSLKVTPQHFNGVEVLDHGPFQHLDSFLFDLFCCRSDAGFGIIVLQLSESNVRLTFDSTILWSSEEFMLSSVTARRLNHQSSTTMLKYRLRFGADGLLFTTCCCALWVNIFTLVTYIQRTKRQL